MTDDVRPEGGDSWFLRLDGVRGDGMDQRISTVTLGVTDLARARRFYERLGWMGQEVEETVFFQAGGLVLVLWDIDKLAADSGVSRSMGQQFGGTTLAQNVRSREGVDDLMAAAASAGGTVTRPAAATFYGGYAGYFLDPDGHCWEIAYNPGFALASDGSITVPDLGG